MARLWCKTASLFFILFVSTSELISWIIATNVNVDGPNLRPIIGIISIDCSPYLVQKFNWCQSSIPAAYVKYVEMGGARVVPIFINRTDDYYEDVFNSVNGILIPGGGVDLQHSGYAEAAQKLFALAVEANDKGDYFPLWGTCLGFEMLAALLANETKTILTLCSAMDLAMPLQMTPGATRSRLFGRVSDDFYSIVTTQNVTSNFHKECLTPMMVDNSTLKSKINVLSVNKDSKEMLFVSTFEALNYPFYGVQWHPEKNPFVWTLKEYIPHSSDAILISQRMATFFVHEAQRNNHHYSNVTQEEKALISAYYKNSFKYLVDINETMVEQFLFKNSSSSISY